MSADGGSSVRGYRPSRFGLPDEHNLEAEEVRSANLELYSKRATAGLPIFEEDAAPPTNARARSSLTAG
jgi:hypothetical protein